MRKTTDQERETAQQVVDALVEQMLSASTDPEQRLMILLSFHDFFAALPDAGCYEGMKLVEEWGLRIQNDPALSADDKQVVSRIAELARERIMRIVGGSTTPS